MNASITWLPVDLEPPYCMPDAEINVLIFADGNVCEGFLTHDETYGLHWFDVTGLRVLGVTHWAEMPQGPTP